MIAARPHIRKWTRAEYYRMADLGWFDNQRVELIEGTVVQMPPQKNFHGIGIGLAEQAAEAAFGPRYWVRTQTATAPWPSLSAGARCSRRSRPAARLHYNRPPDHSCFDRRNQRNHFGLRP